MTITLIRTPEEELCWNCDGSGLYLMFICEVCNGSGVLDTDDD